MRLHLAIAVLGMMAGVSFGDVLADFKRDYPSGAEKLDVAYSQVRMEEVSVRKTNEGEAGEQVEEQHFEFLRNGDLLRKASVLVKTPEKRLLHYTVITGGGPDFSYYCWRMGNSPHFVFGSYGNDEKMAEQLPYECAGVCEPTRQGGRKMMDVLQEKGRNVLGAARVIYEGREAIEVTTNLRRLVVQRFYFDAETWARLGFEFVWPNGTTLTSKVAYDWTSEAGIPRLRSVDTVGMIGTRRDHNHVEVRKLEFIQVPVNAFSSEGLKALGVTELPQAKMPPTTQGK